MSLCKSPAVFGKSVRFVKSLLKRNFYKIIYKYKKFIKKIKNYINK